MMAFEYRISNLLQSGTFVDADICQRSKVKIILHKNMASCIAIITELFGLFVFSLYFTLLKPHTLWLHLFNYQLSYNNSTLLHLDLKPQKKKKNLNYEKE